MPPSSQACIKWYRNFGRGNWGNSSSVAAGFEARGDRREQRRWAANLKSSFQRSSRPLLQCSLRRQRWWSRIRHSVCHCGQRFLGTPVVALARPAAAPAEPAEALRGVTGTSLVSAARDHLRPSPKKSTNFFGTMRPKLIANKMKVAEMPSETVAFSNGSVVWAPPAICNKPLIILKR